MGNITHFSRRITTFAQNTNKWTYPTVIPHAQNGTTTMMASTAQSTAPSLDTKMKKVSDRRGYLSTVIGGIKSATTKYANAHDIPFAWVQRFYDVIIKDEIQMENTINYIKSNVANWEK